ncbi:hypothetical protein ACA910_019227 [Epithemia clementina (nom. ined.)]
MEDFFRARDSPAIGHYYEQQQEQQRQQWSEEQGTGTTAAVTAGLPRYALHDLVLTYYGNKWWNFLWDYVDIDQNNELNPMTEFAQLDVNANGVLDAYDVWYNLHHMAGLSTHPDEYTLVHYVLRAAQAGSTMTTTTTTTSSDWNSASPTRPEPEKPPPIHSGDPTKITIQLSLEELNQARQQRRQQPEQTQTIVPSCIVESTIPWTNASPSTWQQDEVAKEGKSNQGVAVAAAAAKTTT